MRVSGLSARSRQTLQADARQIVGLCGAISQCVCPAVSCWFKPIFAVPS